VKAIVKFKFLIVQILLHAGANLTIAEKRENKTPLELAQQFNEVDIISVLIRAEGNI
jgi:hypothetical protein